MTEMDQVKCRPAMVQGDYGWDSIQGLGHHTGLVGGMLISAGIAISLVVALTKVRRLGLWMIPTVLYLTGTLLVAESPAKP